MWLPFFVGNLSASNLGSSDSPRCLSSVGPWWGWFNENSFDLKMLIYKDTTKKTITKRNSSNGLRMFVKILLDDGRFVFFPMLVAF